MDNLATPRFLQGVAMGVIASAVTAFLIGCVYSIASVYPYIPDLDEIPRVCLLVGSMAALVAVVVTFLAFILLGLPLYLASTRTDILSLTACFLAGIVVALIADAVLLFWSFYIREPSRTDIYLAAVCALVCGPISTSAFWMAARPILRIGTTKA